MKYKVLSIAGLDPSGGAGVLADVKTFSAIGCYGMAVVTAITAQNTHGVSAVFDVSANAVRQQLEKILEDIMPDAIKIGMLFNEDIILTVTDVLQKMVLPKKIPIVLDPVMMAKSGDALLQPAAMAALKKQLVPLTDIITPNLREAEALLGCDTISAETMASRAKELLALGSQSVLLKGGHLEQNMSDDYYVGADMPKGLWLTEARIKTKNTHGTGCTLSSAIASYLAKDAGNPKKMAEACQEAKRYLTGALRAVEQASVGGGAGPLHHFYQR